MSLSGRLGRVKALFHHDKNGYFYALDRTNGKFLYGDAIVPGINWSFGLDPVTGRPKGESGNDRGVGRTGSGSNHSESRRRQRLAPAFISSASSSTFTFCPINGRWG